MFKRKLTSPVEEEVNDYLVGEEEPLHHNPRGFKYTLNFFTKYTSCFELP